jgi:hypothetical protein
MNKLSDEAYAIIEDRHSDPFRYLGLHKEGDKTVARAFLPACPRSVLSTARLCRWIAVWGADPLNLAGTLTRGPKIAALTGNRELYRDSVLMASLVAGEATCFEELDPAAQWQIRQALLLGAEHYSIACTRVAISSYSCTSFAGDMTVETTVARARFQYHVTA